MPPTPPETEADPPVAPGTGADDAPTATGAGSDEGTGTRPGDGTGRDLVVRRAPFADRPHVGARGQQTRQRLLDAALQAFGEVGYHRAGIARITGLAGCSRASFYQYFSGKEDLFDHLAGQVARQVRASTEALAPVTGDLDGWTTVRTWVARHGEIFDRYAPVFTSFPAAAGTDAPAADRAARIGERNIALFRSKLRPTALTPRKLDPVLYLVMACLARTHETARVLETYAPDSYPRDRIDDALADVIHRTLFGLQAAVNVHPPADRPAPTLRFGPVLSGVFLRQVDDGDRDDMGPAGRRTLEALVDAGRDVFLARGHHGTRVDDIVAAAGVSHGAFYRYFRNKDDLAHLLAGRAMQSVSRALISIPDTTGNGGDVSRATLRNWLRNYNASQAAETAMIRVWIDAATLDPTLGPESAALLDWGRRRTARFLAPRDFGDVDSEALVMLELLSAFGTRERPPETVTAAAHIVEHGLLGR